MDRNNAIHPDNTESVHHLFVITTDNRKDLIKYLKDKNIYILFTSLAICRELLIF